jgi:hypothetical protein
MLLFIAKNQVPPKIFRREMVLTPENASLFSYLRAGDNMPLAAAH